MSYKTSLENTSPCPDTEVLLESADIYQNLPFLPANKLSLFFDDEKADRAVLAQFKMQRKLYRELNDVDDIRDLEQRVSTIINRWSFSDYCFVRLDALRRNGGKTALMPTGLLASYKDGQTCGAGMVLNTFADDNKSRHLSALYAFLASVPAEQLSRLGGVYLLIVSVGAADCYIAAKGVAKSGRYLSGFSLVEEGSVAGRSQHILDKRRLLDLLAIAIESVGVSKFAPVFQKESKYEEIKIKPGPLRLLNALAKRDVTLYEAADFLHLSTDTINKHMAAAKAALGTKTLAGTVWEAVKKGLIDNNA